MKYKIMADTVEDIGKNLSKIRGQISAAVRERSMVSYQYPVR